MLNSKTLSVDSECRIPILRVARASVVDRKEDKGAFTRILTVSDEVRGFSQLNASVHHTN